MNSNLTTQSKNANSHLNNMNSESSNTSSHKQQSSSSSSLFNNAAAASSPNLDEYKKKIETSEECMKKAKAYHLQPVTALEILINIHEELSVEHRNLVFSQKKKIEELETRPSSILEQNKNENKGNKENTTTSSSIYPQDCDDKQSEKKE